MRRSRVIALHAWSQRRRHALAEGQRVCAGRRGETDRRILISVTRDGIEHRLHATKGWRVTRVAA